MRPYPGTYFTEARVVPPKMWRRTFGKFRGRLFLAPVQGKRSRHFPLDQNCSWTQPRGWAQEQGDIRSRDDGVETRELIICGWGAEGFRNLCGKSLDPPPRASTELLLARGPDTRQRRRYPSIVGHAAAAEAPEPVVKTRAAGGLQVSAARRFLLKPMG